MTPPRDLIEILSIKREHNTATEVEFIRDYLIPLGVKPDGFNNYWKVIPNKDQSWSPILWSVHTDTVHHGPGYQEVVVTGDGFIELAKRSKKVGNCLGADDGAGLWLAIRMIKARVPGTYVFHRGEECGGKGSGWISFNLKDALKKYSFAIALDRRGYRDIITHQRNQRCCSEEFAAQLAGILNDKGKRRIGFSYRADDTGTFTDTASYTRIIPECTNLSVGYFSQHGPTESLNLAFILALKRKLISADFSVLKAVRNPAIVEPKKYHSHPYTTMYGGKSKLRDSYVYKFPMSKNDPYGSWVKDNPVYVARLLEELGFELKDVEEMADDFFEDLEAKIEAAKNPKKEPPTLLLPPPPPTSATKPPWDDPPERPATTTVADSDDHDPPARTAPAHLNEMTDDEFYAWAEKEYPSYKRPN